jgi:hypothetical protein
LFWDPFSLSKRGAKRGSHMAAADNVTETHDVDGVARGSWQRLLPTFFPASLEYSCRRVSWTRALKHPGGSWHVLFCLRALLPSRVCVPYSALLFKYIFGIFLNKPRTCRFIAIYQYNLT